MALYVAESTLRDLTLEVLRTNVPSVTAIRLVAIRGPYRLRNWRVDWLDVPAEDYGAARDKADELEAWIIGSWCRTGTRYMGRCSGARQLSAPVILEAREIALGNARCVAHQGTNTKVALKALQKSLLNPKLWQQ